MSVKIRKRTDSKKVARFKRKKRIRGKLCGVPEKPRMVVFRSSRHMVVQFVDDMAGKTLASVSTISKGASVNKDAKPMDVAKGIGKSAAEKIMGQGIKSVVFDRNGYLFHGRVKALADAAREAGLKF